MSADDIVKGWILRSWSDTQHRKKAPSGDERHIWDCGPAVEKADVNWECDCYSDYSRDDHQVLTAVIGCKHGTTVEYNYGYLWDFPAIIRKLLEEQAGSLAESGVCSIEEGK